MRGAHSISTRRAYGVQRVCRVWHQELAPASTRGGRRRRPIAGVAPPRTTSWSATSAGCSTRRPFTAKGTGKPGRSFEGTAPPKRVRRLIGSTTSRPRTARPGARPEGARRDHHHRGDRGTDMTATVTVGEGAACVFVAVDHCTTECIGLHAAKRGTRFEADIGADPPGLRERWHDRSPVGCVFVKRVELSRGRLSTGGPFFGIEEFRASRSGCRASMRSPPGLARGGLYARSTTIAPPTTDVGLDAAA